MIRTRLGNDCDVLVLTPEEFSRLAATREQPVVADILSDGVLLLGSVPKTHAGAA